MGVYSVLAPSCQLNEQGVYTGQGCPVLKTCTVNSCVCPSTYEYTDVGTYCVPVFEVFTPDTTVDNMTETPEPSSKTYHLLYSLKKVNNFFF